MNAHARFSRRKPEAQARTSRKRYGAPEHANSYRLTRPAPKGKPKPAPKISEKLLWLENPGMLAGRLPTEHRSMSGPSCVGTGCGIRSWRAP
jgi:hypothetical protein